MENWISTNKVVIFLYIILQYTSHLENNRPLIILWLLIYASINSSIYIFKSNTCKKLFAVISVIFIIAAYAKINATLIMFLPIGIYECMDYFGGSSFIALLLVLIPIPMLDSIMVSNYVVILCLSYVIFIMCHRYPTRLAGMEKQADRMRKELHRITKAFNDNKEYLRQSEYTFKLEERNRLSQEIHDKIGHSLTGALIQMEAAKTLMDLDKEKARELLSNSINISKEGIEDIRITLKNLKPSKEQMGINRLKLIIGEFAEKTTTKIGLLYKGDMDKISYIQWKVILENISEALTNSIKYSQAANIYVNIEVLNKFIKAEVKDNGKGGKLIKKGLGIIGMEERTSSVSGKIIIDGSKGFSVTTLLPI